MRKHFLLFFLMTLLPLAGWAVTDVTVTLYDFTIPYGAEPTAATLKTQYPSAVKVEGATYDAIKEYLTFARVNDGSANWNSNNVGVYSWTLTKALNTGDYNIYLSSNNAKLTIEKADNGVTNTPAVGAGGAYVAAGYDLVATVPTVKFGTVMYNVTNSTEVPAANAAGWSPDIPHKAKLGTYYVYIKVDEDEYGNYEAIAPKKIAETYSVEITGTNIPAAEYTLPTALGAAIPFDNTAHPLATAGELADEHEHCTSIEYSLDGVDWSTWSTSVPQATNQGNYTVYYRILGIDGWYDKTGSVDATISPAAPTVTSATAATGLKYTGEPQELLSQAGSATIGATPTYSVKYSATNLDDWGAVASEAKATKADVKGTNAGFYQITTLVAAGGNYTAAAATPITVEIAKKAAFTDAPTAANLTWNNDNQQLIVAGAGTVDGIVKYKLVTNETTTQDWTTDITKIKAAAATNAITGTAAVAYHVYYKVENANYTAVPETEIANVKINKKLLSIKVNNVKKTYDGDLSLAHVSTPTSTADDAELDGAPEQFTFIGRITDGLNFGAITYAAIDDANKNAGPHTNVLTIAPAALNAISTNYEYTIIPGTLTVNQAELTVTANLGLNAAYLAAYDISNEYTIGGLAGTETKADAFSTAPVLTTNAPAIKPEPGTYTVEFTNGTLKTNGNYKMSTAGEDEDGYVIGAANFVVNPDADSKIVITVLPKTYTYTGVAENLNSIMERGTDYYVSGLIGTDNLKTLPTFTRSDDENVNVGTYTLTASGAEIDESIAGRYPGGIIYNNSTFEITPVELTATVNQQTVKQGEDDTVLDQTAWTVTGLVGPDAEAADVKTLLGASLSFDAANTAATGLKADAIVLAITNTNYTLAAGSETGDLLVISTTQFALDPTDADLKSKLAVADGDNYGVVFTNKTTNIGEWYAMVLPFEVDPLKMVKAFNRYVIFNELNTAGTTDQNFKFTLTMDPIPAGTPFLIKFAPKDGDAADAVVNWAADFNSATYGDVTIEEDITDVVAPGLVTFTGIYEQKVMQNTKNGANTADIQANVWWLADKGYKGDNAWKKPTNTPHTTKAMEAYLIAGNDFAVYAPKITVEDFDGTVTAIKSISVDEIHGMTAKGMYNLNGMKMNNVPTQKGVYIVNGKKVVIK